MRPFLTILLRIRQQRYQHIYKSLDTDKNKTHDIVIIQYKTQTDKLWDFGGAVVRASAFHLYGPM